MSVIDFNLVVTQFATIETVMLATYRRSILMHQENP